MRVEHEYERCGAWAYLAALDVHRMKLFGRCEKSTGIEPFEKLVADVMQQPPLQDRPPRLLGHGQRLLSPWQCLRASFASCLDTAFPNIIPVHGPVHASWLNQIEIYFSIIQRKVLTPNDFASLADVEDRLLRFQQHYEQIAAPFEWKFTRADLDALLARVQTHEAADPLRRAA
jgi:hypothetical protein